jgi:hypothetical protein
VYQQYQLSEVRRASRHVILWRLQQQQTEESCVYVCCVTAVGAGLLSRDMGRLKLMCVSSVSYYVFHSYVVRPCACVETYPFFCAWAGWKQHTKWAVCLRT